MIAALVPLGILAVALWLFSLLCQAILRGTTSLRDRLSAPARARMTFAVIIAPALLACSFVAGTIVDHHAFGCDDHQCLRLVHDGPLAVFLASIGAIFLVRVAIAAGRSLRTWSAGRRLLAVLERSAIARAGFFEVDVEATDAFVAGFWRPRVFVSSGLLESLRPAELEGVLAHERAHVACRDPLRRVVAAAVSGFHLPGIAVDLEAQFAREIELAADAVAVRSTGDDLGMAEVLLRFARMQLARPLLYVAALVGGDLEARVRQLLDPRPRVDRPSAGAFVMLGALALLATFAASEALHHGLELTLRILFV